MTAQYLTQLNAGNEVSEAAARLMRGGARMQALLDDLRDYNRARLGLGIKIMPTSLDAAPAIADELDLLRASYPNRRFHLEVSGDTRGIWDGMRLRQVLTNLIENAIRYGRDDATIEVVMTGDGSQLVIEVRNEGRTIEPSELKGIFEPLRRSVADERTDSGNSLGLGLYIARQVVEGHGGEIAAQSNRGRTVFSVRLPRRLDSEMGSQPQSASATPTTTHVLGARSLTERRFSRQAASDLAERDAQRPAFANGRGGSSRATVKYFSPDGKSYLELRDADADKSERGELFLRHLSRSIALQRDFSTESLTVSTRCGNVERQTEQAVPWLADD